MFTNSTNHTKDNMSIGSAESLAPRWVSPNNNPSDGSNTTIPTTNAQPGSTPSSPSGRTTTVNTTSNNNSSNNSNNNKPYSHIHWVGILRDGIMLCEYCNEPTNHKVLQMSRRFLKKKDTTTNSSNSNSNSNHTLSQQSPQQQLSPQQSPPHKVDWEFKTYAIQSQRRMVHAIQFHIYEMIPMIPGSRAKLQHLQSHIFLNGETVRIIEYNSNTQKYLIRPLIPLPEAQKLATTGMLVVHAKHLIPIHPIPNPCYSTYTIAALYDGKQLTQNLACQFIEKIMILSENFRHPVVSSNNNNSNSNNNNSNNNNNDSSNSSSGGGGTNSNSNNNNTNTTTNTTTTPTEEMSLQTSFGPILQSQMELFHLDIENAIQQNTLSIENSLEYTKQIIEQNMDIVAQLSNLHAV